jgi:hypothetical protein
VHLIIQIHSYFNFILRGICVLTPTFVVNGEFAPIF